MALAAAFYMGLTSLTSLCAVILRALFGRQCPETLCPFRNVLEYDRRALHISFLFEKTHLVARLDNRNKSSQWQRRVLECDFLLRDYHVWQLPCVQLVLTVQSTSSYLLIVKGRRIKANLSCFGVPGKAAIIMESYAQCLVYTVLSQCQTLPLGLHRQNYLSEVIARSTSAESCDLQSQLKKVHVLLWLR